MANLPFGVTEKEAKEVENEIKDHANWCSEDCNTFSPRAYRFARLKSGESKESVQGDYDRCHIQRAP